MGPLSSNTCFTERYSLFSASLPLGFIDYSSRSHCFDQSHQTPGNHLLAWTIEPIIASGWFCADEVRGPGGFQRKSFSLFNDGTKQWEPISRVLTDTLSSDELQGKRPEATATEIRWSLDQCWDATQSKKQNKNKCFMQIDFAQESYNHFICWQIKYRQFFWSWRLLVAFIFYGTIFTMIASL